MASSTGREAGEGLLEQRFVMGGLVVNTGFARSGCLRGVFRPR
jgi:hypothetical protein